MANVLVPAWYCKTVTRDDQAFCLSETRTFTAYLIARKSVRARDDRGTTLRLSWDPPQGEPYIEIPIVTWYCKTLQYMAVYDTVVVCCLC